MTALAERTVPPGAAVDDTASARWAPVRVTARLAEPIVGAAEQPLLLDGPAAWGAYLAAVDAGVVLPPLGPGVWPLDFALPIATWSRAAPAGSDPDGRLLGEGGRVWGWACSRATYTPAAWTAVDVRRKPAVQEMARYTSERKHHLGLGPYKARSVTHPAVDVREVVWWALADPAALRAVLGRVTHLGRLTRHGHGRVLAWHVTPDPEGADRWVDRPLPADGGTPQSVRAPHHHAGRRVPCLG